MNTLPVRKLKRLIDEVQQTIAESDASVTFIARFAYEVDKDGELGLSLQASSPSVPVGGVPVSAEAGGAFARHWQSLGVGECVLRIHRPGRAEIEIERAALSRLPEVESA